MTREEANARWQALCGAFVREALGNDPPAGLSQWLSRRMMLRGHLEAMLDLLDVLPVEAFPDDPAVPNLWPDFFERKDG